MCTSLFCCNKCAINMGAECQVFLVKCCLRWCCATFGWLDGLCCKWVDFYLFHSFFIVAAAMLKFNGHQESYKCCLFLSSRFVPNLHRESLSWLLGEPYRTNGRANGRTSERQREWTAGGGERATTRADGERRGGQATTRADGERRS